ncbi:hypothetical protein IU11_03410 [Cellulosimicrobium sp. MM]|nr:hypothetical protein IU11_03410 [Cellulosimicrobium sp. MM]
MRPGFWSTSCELLPISVLPPTSHWLMPGREQLAAARPRRSAVGRHGADGRGHARGRVLGGAHRQDGAVLRVLDVAHGDLGARPGRELLLLGVAAVEHAEPRRSRRPRPLPAGGWTYRPARDRTARHRPSRGR